MNFSAKEDDNRVELYKFLDAWSLGNDGISFSASITDQGKLSVTKVTIDKRGNIQRQGDDRQFRVTKETYRFDSVGQFLEIRPRSGGALVTFIPQISD
jgi:hypothetical protein